MDQGIQQLIELIKNVSPVVWNAYLRQAMILWIENIVVSLILIASIIVAVKWLSYRAHDEYDSWSDMISDSALSGVITFIILPVFAFIAVLLIIFAIPMIVNPEYWIINRLIDSIK